MNAALSQQLIWLNFISPGFCNFLFTCVSSALVQESVGAHGLPCLTQAVAWSHTEKIRKSSANTPLKSGKESGTDNKEPLPKPWTVCITHVSINSTHGCAVCSTVVRAYFIFGFGPSFGVFELMKVMESKFNMFHTCALNLIYCKQMN